MTGRETKGRRPRKSLTFATPAKRAAQCIGVGQVHKYDNRCSSAGVRMNSARLADRDVHSGAPGRLTIRQSEQTRGHTAEQSRTTQSLTGMLVSVYGVLQQRTMLPAITSRWLFVFNFTPPFRCLPLCPRYRGHVGKEEAGSRHWVYKQCPMSVDRPDSTTLSSSTEQTGCCLSGPTSTLRQGELDTSASRSSQESDGLVGLRRI